MFSAWKYYIDTTFLHTPRPNMELHSYMKDGMIENWDFFEKVIDYSYEKVTNVLQNFRFVHLYLQLNQYTLLTSLVSSTKLHINAVKY